jgi:thiosulfate/3-mercaptopyruvate sulfurtransferase
VPTPAAPLVAAKDLISELADGPAGTAGRPVVLDVRWRLVPPPKGRKPRRRPDPVGEPDFDAGHVPGASNLPAGSMLDADGQWRSPEELATALRGVVGEAGPVGAYCGSGVSATMLVLAAEIAGVRPPTDPVALYVGSWSNWCAAKRPVETGA